MRMAQPDPVGDLVREGVGDRRRRPRQGGPVQQDRALGASIVGGVAEEGPQKPAAHATVGRDPLAIQRSLQCKDRPVGIEVLPGGCMLSIPRVCLAEILKVGVEARRIQNIDRLGRGEQDGGPVTVWRVDLAEADRRLCAGTASGPGRIGGERLEAGKANEGENTQHDEQSRHHVLLKFKATHGPSETSYSEVCRPVSFGLHLLAAKISSAINSVAQTGLLTVTGVTLERGLPAVRETRRNTPAS